jgi:hypothetical protein
MPTFFRKNELTEEQKNNWDSAIANYKKVLELNALRELNSMNQEQKVKFMGDDMKTFTDQDIKEKLIKMGMMMGNPPGHEKSSLFFRLLSGKRILKNPPPTSYSYPDYEIIELDNERELMLDEQTVDELIKQSSSFISYPHVNINQSAWRVLNVISPTKLEVTHDRWKNEGFVWEIELKEITAEESKCSLCGSFNPSIKKLTTYEQLLKECLHTANEHFYLLKIAIDTEEYKKYEEKIISKYPKEKLENGISVFLQNQLKHTLEKAKNMLNERINNGLPIEPSEQEIQEYAKETEKSYLGNDYFEKDGLLYKKAWMMKRVAPIVLKEDHYLEI